MTSTDTLIRTEAPTCATCDDTGEDAAFGGSCSACQGGTAPTKTPVILTPDEQKVGALADWLGEQTWSDFAQSLSRFYISKGYLSPKQYAAGTSMMEKCLARQADKPAPVADTEKVQGPGMFRQADEVYRVQASRSTGNLYAKVLTASGFEYAAGMIRKLREADRMSLEDAKAYGQETGTCCNCGALLTDPNSIEAGIGPICAGKGHWA